jgi:CRP-like cAMP-binding protein
MPSSDYLDHLSQIRLFSSCNSKELAKIAKASDELSIAAGKVLMTQGQPGREAFVIVDGRATVKVADVEVAELGPGDHVGELALLDGGTRTATVTAASDMTVLVISQRSFFGLIDEVPGLARKIMASLAGMVRELDSQLAPHA